MGSKKKNYQPVKPEAKGSLNRAAAVQDKTPGQSEWKEGLTEEELEQERMKEEKRKTSAKKSQEKQIRENEEKEKQDDDRRKQEREFRHALNKKKPALLADDNGIVEPQDGYVELDTDEGTVWQEVKNEFYCTWCGKDLSEYVVADHLTSVGHRKKATWHGVNAHPRPPQSPQEYDDALPPLPPAPVLTNVEYDRDIFELRCDEWGGSHFQCLACNKVADESHCHSANHVKRVEEWHKSKVLKVQPREEWLLWCFWSEDREEHSMLLRCLLCDKFCHENTAINHKLDPLESTKVHHKRIGHYEDYREWILQRRREYLSQDPSGIMKEIVNRQELPLVDIGGARALEKGHDVAAPGNSQSSFSSAFGAQRQNPPLVPAASSTSCGSDELPEQAYPRDDWPPLDTRYRPSDARSGPPLHRPTPVYPDCGIRLADGHLVCGGSNGYQPDSAPQTPEYLPQSDPTTPDLPEQYDHPYAIPYYAVLDYSAQERDHDGVLVEGYLPLEKGERIVRTHSIEEPGNDHNNFSAYAYFSKYTPDGRQVEGWAPLMCVRPVHSQYP